MPNLNDIAAFADALERPKVLIGQERCVVVRNRHATCRRCIDACKAGAIEVFENEIHCSNDLCIDCGACVSVCPTEALSSASTPVQSVLAGIAQAVGEGTVEDAPGYTRDEDEHVVVIACARIAAKEKERAQDPRVVKVPCLGLGDPSLPLAALSMGATSVILSDGHCVTCKYGWCDPVIQSSMDQAREMLDASLAQSIVRRTGIPELPGASDDVKDDRSSRRDFFSQAVTTMKDTAMTAAQVAVIEKLGATTADPTIVDRLKVGASGTLPQFSMMRHDRILDSAYALGPNEATPIRTGLFGDIEIVTKDCNGCGMCTVFCPTGALKKGEVDPVTKKPTTLEFLPCECVQCGLCEDVCWRHCLKVLDSLTAERLFDLEPRIFNVDPRRR